MRVWTLSHKKLINPSRLFSSYTTVIGFSHGLKFKNLVVDTSLSGVYNENLSLKSQEIDQS